MRARRAGPRALVLAMALAMALGSMLAGAAAWPAPARAEGPSLEERLRALGPPREDEEAVYAQLERALELADAASRAGDEARAARHRELAVALARGIEARRDTRALRAEIARRRAELVDLRARLERAQEASRRSARDRERLEAPR